MTLTIESTEIKGYDITILFDKHQGFQVRVSHHFNGLLYIDSIKNYVNEKSAKRAYKRIIKQF